MINAYRKYFNCSKKEVMWGMSWVNFLMDLATIPDTETHTKSKSDEEVHISPEDEAAELRKDLGL